MPTLCELSTKYKYSPITLKPVLDEAVKTVLDGAIKPVLDEADLDLFPHPSYQAPQSNNLLLKFKIFRP